MIKHTFCILDGIGEKSERKLWSEGILTWEDFTEKADLPAISPERKTLHDAVLGRDTAELGAGNAAYFSLRMKRREHWRLYEAFGEDMVCLDIETNGLQPGCGGVVTMVGLYDGRDYKTLIRGNGLNAESLSRELSRYKYLITFYGASFDVPFLIRSFRGVSFDMPHFDLCFAGKRLGMAGGLKKLEVSLGIARGEDVRGLDGYAAVKLWEAFRGGSAEALELLIAYNREDTVNLRRIAELFYAQLRLATGIEDYISRGPA